MGARFSSLCEFQVRLLFDAPQRSYRDVPLRVRNGHAALLGGVLELNVAALLGNLFPVIRLKAEMTFVDFMCV